MDTVCFYIVCIIIFISSERQLPLKDGHVSHGTAEGASFKNQSNVILNIKTADFEGVKTR